MPQSAYYGCSTCWSGRTSQCEATLNNITGRFWWKKLAQDDDCFANSCLQCMAAEPGEIVPLPLRHALHATTPNEIIHFDFCYIGQSTGPEKYVLIIKDDLTSYVWIMPVRNIDAVTTAECLLKCFATFCTVRAWISVQGSHLMNETVAEIRDCTNSQHHFTLPYCPWCNGTVEDVCRELKTTTNAILNAFHLSATMWLSTLSFV